MVERLVANEKVEGSNPFARSIKNIVNNQNLATKLFQKYIDKKDIRIFGSGDVDQYADDI